MDSRSFRYSRLSLRPDKEKEGQMHYVRPFTYREDWRLLMREVMLRTYELNDGSGRHMAIKVTVSDSGGMDGSDIQRLSVLPLVDVRPFRRTILILMNGRIGCRICIRGSNCIKECPTPSAPRVKINFPDSGRQSKFAGARGDIPVLQTNVTTVKNYLDSILDRNNPKSGQVNFPKWFEVEFL